jgi:hypothetical protein
MSAYCEEIDRLETALAESQQREAEEKAIVDRIWDIFGRPSYESLHGKTIYDLITDLQQENDRLREGMRHYANRNNWVNGTHYRGTILGYAIAEQALAAKEKP